METGTAKLCCFVDLAFKSIFLQARDLPGCEMYHSVYAQGTDTGE